MRMIAGPQGAAGVITETQLATGKTTAQFFADTLDSNRLMTFYDFENEAKIFKIHNQLRFAVTVMAGRDRRVQRARFAVYTRHIADVPSRRFELAAFEVLLLNPNTGTLPMFRTRTDADITLGIYRRHPVLIRDNDPDGNPWGVSFDRLFDMDKHSGLFQQPDDLGDADFDGWSYQHDGTEYVPLYEGKMLGHFDHRFGTYRCASQAQMNKGTLPRVSDSDHDDPNLESHAHYWVERSEVADKLKGNWEGRWLLGWRDNTKASNERTFIPSVLPTSAVGDTFLLAYPSNPAHGPLLHAVWSSLVFDYVARQKLSGSHIKYFTTMQLACPRPSTFEAVVTHPWVADRA